MNNENNNLPVLADDKPEGHKYSFSQIEKYLLSLGLLHFENVPSIEAASNDAFILELLRISKTHPTFDASGVYQCSQDRRRSLGDIFRIARYYEPTISVREVYNSLINITNNLEVKSLVCNTLHRRTWYVGESWHGKGWGADTLDEFGNKYPRTAMCTDEMETASNSYLHFIDIP